MCGSHCSAAKAEELGVNTILTSGQEADCLAGSVLLAELVKHSRSLTIMAGAGVTSSNLAELAAKNRSARVSYVWEKMLPSGVCYRNERVHMGLEGLSEFTIYRTDEEEIRRAAEILKSL